MTVPITGAGAAGPARSDVTSAAEGDGELTKAGEAFERALLGQLTRTLTDSAFGGEDEPSSAAAGAYRDLLPEALTDALVRGGGIGLARALDRGPLG
jgi:hypothetical protein